MIDQETGAIPFLPKWRGAALSRDPRGSGVLFPEAYTSAEIFQRERESIFFRSWKYVAHVSELPSPGSFVTTSLVGQNLLLIRGNDEIIRGFFNVCQHRGHELLSGSGKVPVIRWSRWGQLERGFTTITSSVKACLVPKSRKSATIPRTTL